MAELLGIQASNGSGAHPDQHPGAAPRADLLLAQAFCKPKPFVRPGGVLLPYPSTPSSHRVAMLVNSPAGG